MNLYEMAIIHDLELRYDRLNLGVVRGIMA